MKKTLFALATMLAIPLAMADAPTTPPPGFGGPGPNIERMARILDLTPEQQEKLKAVQAEQQQARDAMRAQHQARIKEVLTAQQYEKWSDLRAMRQEHRAQRMAGMGGGMRGMGGMGGCDGTGPHGYGWR